jgi:hypothetical protein
MNTLFEATPISIVKESRMHWRLELDIYPIDMQCIDGLTDRLENDQFFDYTDVSFICQRGQVTGLVLESEGLTRDKGTFSYQVEQRIADVMDEYIDEIGGYAQVQA